MKSITECRECGKKFKNPQDCFLIQTPSGTFFVLCEKHFGEWRKTI